MNVPNVYREWHYVITGPPDSPYSGGQYHGKLVFPPEYPYKPPKILMMTPNGRFQTNTRLCLSMSDFHPSSWNPSWSVSTILTGLLSFMLEDTATTGSIETNIQTKRMHAQQSFVFNQKNPKFRDVFPELIRSIESSEKNPLSNDQDTKCIETVAKSKNKNQIGISNKKEIKQSNQLQSRNWIGIILVSILSYLVLLKLWDRQH